DQLDAVEFTNPADPTLAGINLLKESANAVKSLLRLMGGDLNERVDGAGSRRYLVVEVEMHDVAIVGAGPAGLSAAIYLGRAMRSVLVINTNKSMCRWEPHVENYLGFPDGISGDELLERGRKQTERYKVEFLEDSVETAHGELNEFVVVGKNGEYRARRILLATGIFHIPPAIPELDCCLGHSMFFCKDCDGFRVQGKKIGIVGTNNDTVEYALGMLTYSPCAFVLTNGSRPTWDKQHGEWLAEYSIRVFNERIEAVHHEDGRIRSITFKKGDELLLDTLFTTRGDVFHNRIAHDLGAELDDTGEVIVDQCMMTSVKGVYAAGCVTPANCQIIIAAGQGAIAAQSINRNLFEQSLKDHSLLRTREGQLEHACTEPQFIH
ncbi:MAG: NAD(P)/FAD-dependent oxidoreductase, partial [Limisphaerales bacterium]